MKRYPEEQVFGLVSELLRAVNVDAPDATAMARQFIQQEMRGVTTHGLRQAISNVNEIRSGSIKARPNRKLVVDREAVAVIDGDGGPGPTGCWHAMHLAMEKASRYGIAMVSVIRTNHFQSAAPYCIAAAEKNMIGVALSNTHASMGYPGARGNVIGNNPLGFALPTPLGYPMVFDSALGPSMGHLLHLVRSGGVLPGYLASLDANDDWTTDPQKVVDGGTPIPIGYHKGAGLALMVECLTGLIAGGAFLSDIRSPNLRTSDDQGDTQTCIAINIAHFMPVETFFARVASLQHMLENLSADSLMPVRVPGQRAADIEAESKAAGIRVPDDIHTALETLSQQLNVRFTLRD